MLILLTALIIMMLLMMMIMMMTMMIMLMMMMMMMMPIYILLNIFKLYADADTRSMTPSRNTRSYTLRSVPRTVIFVINLLLTFVNVSLLILVKFSRLIS